MSISAGIVIFEGKFLPEVVRNGRKYVPVDAVVNVLFPRVPSHVDPFDIFRELGGHTGVQQHIASWPETRVLQNIQGISHGKPREGTFPLVLLDDLKLCYPELCRICKRYGSKVDKAREEDGRQTMQAEDRDGYRNRDSKETRTKQKTDLLTTNNHSGRGEASPSTDPLKASRIASVEQKVKSGERRCRTDVKKVDAAVDTPHEQSDGFKNRGESSRNKSHLNPSSLKNNACYTDYRGWVVIDQVTAESECSSVLTLESGKTKNDRHCHPADTNPVSNNACSHEEPQKGHIRDLTDQQEESPEEFTSQHTSPRLHCPPTGVAPCSVGMHKSPLCTTPTTCGGPQEHEESSDPAVEVCPVSPHANQNPDASVDETGSSCQTEENSAVGNRSVQGETPNIRADEYILEKISPDPKGNISVTKVEEPQGSTTDELHDRGNQMTNSSATMASSMQSPRRELDLPHQHTKADKKDTSINSSTVSESDIPPTTGIQRDRNLWSSLEMLDLFGRPPAGNIEDVGGSARPAGKGCTIHENIAVHNNGVTPPDLSPPRSRVEISRSSKMASAHCLHKDLSRATDLKVPEKDTVSMGTTAGRRDVRGTTSSTTASVEVTGNAEKTELDAVTSHRPASRLGGKDTAIATETPYNQLKQVRIEPTDCKGSTDDTEEESIGLVMECVPEPTFTKARFKVPQENTNNTFKTVKGEDHTTPKRCQVTPGSTLESPHHDQPNRDHVCKTPTPSKKLVATTSPPLLESSAAEHMDEGTTRCGSTTQDAVETEHPILTNLLKEPEYPVLTTLLEKSTPSDGKPSLGTTPPSTNRPLRSTDEQPEALHPAATRKPAESGAPKAAQFGKLRLNKKDMDVVQVGTTFYCRATAVSTGVPSFTSSMLKKLCPIFGVHFISVDQVGADVMSCFESLGYSQIRCLNVLKARIWRLFALLSFLETAFCQVDRKERPTMERAVSQAREAMSHKVMINNDLVHHSHALMIYYRSGGAYIPLKEFQQVYPRVSLDCLNEMCDELNITVGLAPPAVLRSIGHTIITSSLPSMDLHDFKVVTVPLDLRDLSKLLLRIESNPGPRLQCPQPSTEENPVASHAVKTEDTSDHLAAKFQCPQPSMEERQATQTEQMEVANDRLTSTHQCPEPSMKKVVATPATTDRIAGSRLVGNTKEGVVGKSIGQASKATASASSDTNTSSTVLRKHGLTNIGVETYSSNRMGGRCGSLRMLRVSPSPPILSEKHTSDGHVGPSDANYAVSTAPSLETVQKNYSQRVDIKGSTESLEKLSNCAKSPTAAETGQPSGPHGVASDSQMDTLPSATEINHVNTAAAPSTSNGSKTTTAGVTVLRCPVPEPCGEPCGTTAEPHKVTVATNSMVGIITQDKAEDPPRHEVRYCHKGVVDIAQRNPTTKDLLRFLEVTQQAPNQPEEMPGVPSTYRDKETPEADESSAVLDLTVSKVTVPTAVTETSLRKYTYQCQEGRTGPYKYGKLRKGDSVVATLEHRRRIFVTIDDFKRLTNWKGPIDTTWCRRFGFDLFSDESRPGGILLGCDLIKIGSRREAPEDASTKESTPDALHSEAHGHNTNHACNDATNRHAVGTGEKIPPKQSQQHIKSETGVSTCAYEENVSSSSEVENTTRQQGDSRPRYSSQARVTSQIPSMPPGHPATVGELRPAAPPLNHLDEVQTYTGTVGKSAFPSPANPAAFGPPNGIPAGAPGKRKATPPLHHVNVQAVSRAAEESVSSSPPNSVASCPPNDILTGAVNRKRKASPMEGVFSSKRKSPVWPIENAVQQQRGQREESTNTDHVRQAVNATRDSDAIYKENHMRVQLRWEHCGFVDGVPKDKTHEMFPVVTVYGHMKVALASDIVSLFPYVNLTDFMRAVGQLKLRICACPPSIRQLFLQAGKNEASCATVIKLADSVFSTAKLLSQCFSQQGCHMLPNENAPNVNNGTDSTIQPLQLSSTGYRNNEVPNGHAPSSTPNSSGRPNVNYSSVVPISTASAPSLLGSPENNNDIKIVAVQSLATGEFYNMTGRQQTMPIEGMHGSAQRVMSQHRQSRIPTEPFQPPTAASVRMESAQRPYQHPVSTFQQSHYPPPPPPYQTNTSATSVIQAWAQMRRVEDWQQHAFERNRQPSEVPGVGYTAQMYSGLRTGWDH
ncbi:uncharacterized protein LOC118406853 [Branchiostoma floridae]|uniref:Uncharacterized protein LOC118406853 n=1 Tax=Branchiostoma floridae TaxID=7739 RepID=A0A9J7HRG6_BRAFL|nr:uncharacterized protein LOC118406853 [Branchiostoma floridae]XP_035663114.1 uncharacterized protein LOC118406853 [Branchiostoma floridae]XP_035663125.1 uncharacterized protein LOC118406853 [Branchiostoma floridae]